VSELESIPDFEALRSLQSQLWVPRRVALMVGAGVSRMGCWGDGEPPPVWADLRDQMLRELAAEQDVEDDSLLQIDALDLAEEYVALKGRCALKGLILDRFANPELRPGQFHTRLLSLPWVDVLTTNWDTLLESTPNGDAGKRYDIVLTPADISRTTSPRIVKLHGSLPELEPFVLTREDFRTYPVRLAPFENLVRNAMLENDVCLIGFSGDDPNFLEWSGWVRDQLGTEARRIFMVGNLKLWKSRRRFFENRNITPIDLSHLVKDAPPSDQDARASEIFLQFLESGKQLTPAWTPVSDFTAIDDCTEAEEKINSLIESWIENRHSHPGWLIAPLRKQHAAQRSLRKALGVLRANLDQSSQEAQARVLQQLVWQLDVANMALPADIESRLEDLVQCGDDQQWDIQDRIATHKSLAGSARGKRDWPAFEQRISRLREIANVAAMREARYEDCLRARDELNLNFIASHVDHIDAPSPLWKMRKASLLAEIGCTLECVSLLEMAYEQIQVEIEANKWDSRLLSIHAWCSWLLLRGRWATHDWGKATSLGSNGNNIDSDSDPDEILDEIEKRVLEIESRSKDHGQAPALQFDPGVYIISERYYSETDELSALIRISDRIGLPLRIGNMNVISPIFIKCLAVSPPTASSPWYALRAIAANSNSVIDEWFDRSSIANLPPESAIEFAYRIRGAIEFGIHKYEVLLGDPAAGNHMDWIGPISELTGLLSRLVLVLSSEEALSHFRFGVAIASNSQIQNLFRPPGRNLEALLSRSLESISPGKRTEVAHSALNLPLMVDPRFGDSAAYLTGVFESFSEHDWRDQIELPGWSKKISELIEIVELAPSDGSRADATQRLLCTFKGGALTGDEIQRFSSALWSHVDQDGMPSGTTLISGMFLVLPSPEGIEPRRAFDKSVVQKIAQGNFAPSLLQSLYRASFGIRGEYESFGLDEDVAANIFQKAVNWTPNDLAESISNFSRLENQSIDIWIGRALAASVLPSISASAIDRSICAKLLESAGDGTRPGLLIALPAITPVDPEYADQSTQVIRHALTSSESHEVICAISAVEWMATLEEEGTFSVPDALVDALISICVMRREPGLVSALTVIRRFINGTANWTARRNDLIGSLDRLRVEADYNRRNSPKTQSDLTSLRRSSVALAVSLSEAGESGPTIDFWISQLENDPLPEVRFAKN
jgi:hypothetical protein